MLAAVKKGNGKKLAELIKQDPGFKVNMQDGEGFTFLHYACNSDSRSPVIPLLLAHPDIDVNVENKDRQTPFYLACFRGHTSCVRELLKDSRVKLNEPHIYGFTPLWFAAGNDRLDIIKSWIASGREMDLGKPGEIYTSDAIGVAKNKGKTEVVTLLERFKSDPTKTRSEVRLELDLLDDLAAEMFALVVFVSDGLLRIKRTTPSPAARYLKIASRLPLELQMLLCFRVVGSAKEIIPGTEREAAFRELARRLW